MASTNSVITSPTPAQWFMLLIIVVIGTILRFVFIEGVLPHFDELWHLELSTGRGSAHLTMARNIILPDSSSLTLLNGAPPWYKIPASLSTVTHPPLFPILLRFWRDVFGDSLATARSFAAILGILCILIFFDCVRLLEGSVIALWAALIFALASTQIQIAQEVRNYTLLLLCMLSAIDALLRIQQFGGSTARLITFFLALLAAMFSHYFAAPAIFALGIYALIRFRGRIRLKILGMMLLAAMFFFTTWSSMIWRQSEAISRAADPGSLGEMDSHPKILTVNRLLVEPMRLIFEPQPEFGFTSKLGAVLFVIPWLLLPWRPQLLLWALMLWCVVGFAFFLDLAHTTRHMEQLRHTILAGPAVYALLPAILAGQRPMLKNGLCAIIALACCGPLGLAYKNDTQDWRSVGVLMSHVGKNEPIVFFGAGRVPFEWSGLMLLSASQYSGIFPHTIVRLDRTADASLLQQLHRWPRLWLVMPSTDLDITMLPGTKIIDSGSVPFIGSVIYLKWSDAPTR
jgi:uncharacterized membrane protein